MGISDINGKCVSCGYFLSKQFKGVIFLMLLKMEFLANKYQYKEIIGFRYSWTN